MPNKEKKMAGTVHYRSKNGDTRSLVIPMHTAIPYPWSILDIRRYQIWPFVVSWYSVTSNMERNIFIIIFDIQHKQSPVVTQQEPIVHVLIYSSGFDFSNTTPCVARSSARHNTAHGRLADDVVRAACNLCKSNRFR